MDRILNCKDTCSALSISKATLYRLSKAGQIKKIKLSKGRVGWRQSDLVSFINKRLTVH
jgi:predicted DNA-binding transcriptional regulator AlpA